MAVTMAVSVISVAYFLAAGHELALLALGGALVLLLGVVHVSTQPRRAR